MINNKQMTDKEFLFDSLDSQKLITSNYNNFANEIACSDLRRQFMDILNDEHQLQYEVFNELQSRGWYQLKDAQQQDVSQIKQKYSSM